MVEPLTVAELNQYVIIADPQVKFDLFKFNILWDYSSYLFASTAK